MTDYTPRIGADELSFGAYFGSELEQQIAEFAAAAVRADALDPVITELVRLRCAQVHDCRLCGSLRDTSALAAGFDEAMQKKIGAWESSDFSAPIKAALALCDAMILHPGAIDAGLAAELRQHFSDAAIAEICVDVMKWSQQKALVALRVEPPASSEHLTQLSFDGDGNPVIGGAIADH